MSEVTPVQHTPSLRRIEPVQRDEARKRAPPKRQPMEQQPDQTPTPDTDTPPHIDEYA